MAVGGVRIPAAVQQAAPPRRIQWGRGTLAGPRQWCRSDRGFTAAVGIPIEAPPACRRCSRGPPPWRSKTARVRMRAYVYSMLKDFAVQMAKDFGGYSNFGEVLIRPKSDGKVTDIPPAVLRVP
ncbi:hypothetical protein NDU88_003197 [Pleurodeles waltl]|uniref:Uncharacterized protein n=1 Tax=Pleurodeles waltl TaxID=8319 RepID=A0AAV7SFF0_PLEWA|nr:hypothetical protein NDU88_003197 [Pleurodeles waltl]